MALFLNIRAKSFKFCKMNSIIVYWRVHLVTKTSFFYLFIQKNKIKDSVLLKIMAAPVDLKEFLNQKDILYLENLNFDEYFTEQELNN